MSKMNTIIGSTIVNGSIFKLSLLLLSLLLVPDDGESDMPRLDSTLFSKKAARPVRKVEIPARK
jgi:hypothetical protein